MEKKETTDHETFENMTRYGGSFVKALAEACKRADQNNLEKLKSAFPEYLSKYRSENWSKKNNTLF